MAAVSFQLTSAVTIRGEIAATATTRSTVAQSPSSARTKRHRSYRRFPNQLAHFLAFPGPRPEAFDHHPPLPLRSTLAQRPACASRRSFMTTHFQMLIGGEL